MKSSNGKDKKIVNMLTQVLVPIMIYYMVNNLLVIAGLSIVQIGKTKLLPGFAAESFWFYMETGIKMAGMALGGLAVFPYYKQEKSCQESKSLSGRDALYVTILGIVLSLGINFLFSATGFTQSSEQYQQVAEIQFALPPWLACIFYGLISPVVEEILFRGIVCQALTRTSSKTMGIIGSALLFGAFHGNIVQMVYASIMGAVMACLYQKYQNLSASVLFHGAANVAIYVMTYFF